jgi:hypothetical protein
MNEGVRTNMDRRNINNEEWLDWDVEKKSVRSACWGKLYVQKYSYSNNNLPTCIVWIL